MLRLAGDLISILDNLISILNNANVSFRSALAIFLINLRKERDVEDNYISHAVSVNCVKQDHVSLESVPI